MTTGAAIPHDRSDVAIERDARLLRSRGDFPDAKRRACDQARTEKNCCHEGRSKLRPYVISAHSADSAHSAQILSRSELHTTRNPKQPRLENRRGASEIRPIGLRLAEHDIPV